MNLSAPISRAVPMAALAAAAAIMATAACGGGGSDGGGDDETPPGNTTPETTYNLVMNESRGNVFVLDGQFNPTLRVPAGAQITINLDNKGSAIHNMRFSGEDKKYNTKDDAVSKPDIVASGQKAVMTLTAPSKPGKYAYQCDFHPTDMRGEFEVVG